MQFVVLAAGASTLHPVGRAIVTGFQTLNIILLVLVFMCIMVQTFLCYILEICTGAKKHRTKIVVGITTFYFLLAIPTCLDGPSNLLVLQLLHLNSSYSKGLIIIGICMCVAVAYVFGVDSYLCGINYMLSQKLHKGRIPWVYWRWYLKIHWCFVTPVTLAGLLFIAAPWSLARSGEEGDAIWCR